ncbi:MAG: HAD family phosphatase [Clostridia bacterium]|nr:HAD family phosphatase [Clostridia bacterium]
MLRLLILDLDGTLAPYDAAATVENIQRLKEIENSSVKICLCSGKPVFYSCAFMRQIGLKDPILIGENGAEIQFGVHLPPRWFYHAEYSEKAYKSLRFFKKEIKKAIPSIWFQPNQTELSPFPKSRKEFAIIKDIIDKNQDKIQDIHIFEYFDCFDFIPVGINKGSALKLLSDTLHIPPEEMISIGDSQNDFPMFDYTAKSYGIKLKKQHPKAKNVDTLDEALDEIIQQL